MSDDKRKFSILGISLLSIILVSGFSSNDYLPEAFAQTAPESPILTVDVDSMTNNVSWTQTPVEGDTPTFDAEYAVYLDGDVVEPWQPLEKTCPIAQGQCGPLTIETLADGTIQGSYVHVHQIEGNFEHCFRITTQWEGFENLSTEQCFLSEHNTRATSTHEYVGGAPPIAAEIEAALMTANAQTICDVTSGPFDPEQAYKFTTSAQGFSTDPPDYVILSSGQAADALGVATDFVSLDMLGTDGQIHPFAGSDINAGLANDVGQITITCTIPAGAETLSVDWIFGSEEIPTQLPGFVDYFRGTVEGIDFVFLPDNISPVTTNNAFDGGFTAPASPDEVVYDQVTALATSTFDLTSLQGQIVTVVFEVADDDDTSYDSAAFLDNFDIIGDLTSPQVISVRFTDTNEVTIEYDESALATGDPENNYAISYNDGDDYQEATSITGYFAGEVLCSADLTTVACPIHVITFPATFDSETDGIVVINPFGATVQDESGNEVPFGTETDGLENEIPSNTPPVLSLKPTDIGPIEPDTVPIAPTITATDAEDEPDPPVIFSETVISGTIVSGTYTLERTWTTTDSGGLSDSHTQTIIVVDTVAPTIVGIPADRTEEAIDANGATTTFTVPTATDNNPADLTPAVTCDADSDLTVFTISDFISEEHTVTCSSTDASGNLGDDSFLVTVVDTTAPLLPTPETVIVNTAELFCDEETNSCSTDLDTKVVDFTEGSVLFFVNATGPTGTVVNYEITSTDAVGTTSIVCSAISDDDPDPTVGDTSNSQVIEGTGQESLVANNGVNSLDAVLLNDGLTSGQLFEIDDLIDETHTVTCTATDTVGNSSESVFDVIIRDIIPPIVFAPIDTATPVDAIGVYTPIDIELGTAGGAGNVAPEGAFAADLVSTVGITTGVPAFGNVDVTNNRPAQNDLCIETDNDDLIINNGDVLPCFFALDNVITYTATDTAGNSEEDTQNVVVNPTPVEMGWHDEDLNGFFLVESTSTVLVAGENQEHIDVIDYRNNLNNSKRDSITIKVNTLSEPAGINVVLNELGKNTGIFRSEIPITLSLNPSNDAFDILQVEDNKDAFALYTSPLADPLLNPDSGLPFDKEIVTSITALASGATRANSDDPMSMGLDVFIIETSGTLTIFDETKEGNTISGEVVCTATMQSPSNESIGNENGNTAAISICLVEDADTGVFTGLTQIGFTGQGTSDRSLKVIRTEIGEDVTFIYPGLPLLKVGIIDTPDEGFTADTVGADFGLRLTCISDKDGDFLCDEWETEEGLRIEYTDESENTIVWFEECDQNITNDCPNPLRKDIYLEIDYMSSHKPDDRAVDLFKAAFTAAPVLNPGGTEGVIPGTAGINVHVLVDNDILDHRFLMPFETQDEGLPTEILGFADRKNIWFGTNDETGRQTDGSVTFDGTVCEGCVGTAEDIATLKRQAYHYSLWIHDQQSAPGSSGLGEMGGNDFLVSLGSFAGGRGSFNEQAATLMHEFGHNLNLHHGGGVSEVNCKPNLISVMNYPFQFSDYVTDRPLDYSRIKLETIDSRYLVESEGISAYHYPFPTNTAQPKLSTIYGSGFLFDSPLISSTGVPIDWNRDGHIETDSDKTFEVNIQRMTIPGCENISTTGILPSENEWAVIDFDFRTSDVFASGASTLQFSIGNLRGVDEPTPEVFSELVILNLDVLQASIDELEPPACSQPDIDTLNHDLESIRDIFRTDEERKVQLENGIVALDDLSISSAYLSCLSGTPADDELDELQEVYLEASTGTVDMFNEHPPKIDKKTGEIKIDKKTGFPLAAIDSTKNKPIHLVVQGTPEFDVTLIDTDTVFFGPEGDETSGAQSTPEYDDVMLHQTDDNLMLDDEILDIEFHFSMNEITDPNNNDIDTDNDGILDAQRLCLVGKTVVGLPFTGCIELTVSPLTTTPSTSPTTTPLADDDGDGYTVDVDCDDTNASINPGATENPDNTVDDDCDGEINEASSSLTFVVGGDANPTSFTIVDDTVIVSITAPGFDFNKVKKIETEMNDSNGDNAKAQGIPPFEITGQTATVTLDISSLAPGPAEFKIKLESTSKDIQKIEFKFKP